jgi:hypothetical protein
MRSKEENGALQHCRIEVSVRRYFDKINTLETHDGGAHMTTSSKTRSYYLAEMCTELVQDGSDFPIVWNTVLKGHPLVDDIPHSKCDGARWEVHLTTGEHLIFDRDRKKFDVEQL